MISAELNQYGLTARLVENGIQARRKPVRPMRDAPASPRGGRDYALRSTQQTLLAALPKESKAAAILPQGCAAN